MDYQTFIYDEQRRFIFVYVPKVACTNWKSIMRYLAGHADYLNSARAHDKASGDLRYLDLDGPDMDIARDPDVAKYAFVRDPYSRTLSGYLNKVENRLKPRPDQANKPDNPARVHFGKVVEAIDGFRRDRLDPGEHPEVTFEVFLRWLRDGDGKGKWLRNDEHWQAQSVLLRYPEVSYDFLGRFEYMNEEAPVLLQKMGCDIGFPSQKDVKFPPTNARTKVDRYYNPACFALVNQLFAVDFENFGYARRS